MNFFYSLMMLGILSACAPISPVPPEVTEKVALISVDDLPKNNHLEQTRCPKSRYVTFEKRMNCKVSVRRELAARNIMREHAIVTKDQSHEVIQH